MLVGMVADDVKLPAHLGPALLVVIRRVAAPFVMRVFAAATDRHDAAAHVGRAFANGGEGPSSGHQPFGIGVCHIIGGRYGGDADPCPGAGLAHFPGGVLGNGSGQRSKTGAGHIVLHSAEAGIPACGKDGGGAVAFKTLGEYPDLHQMAPDTSARFTGLPVAADSPMASIALTEAMPSATSAPATGLSFSTASAKLSSCRL